MNTILSPANNVHFLFSILVHLFLFRTSYHYVTTWFPLGRSKRDVQERLLWLAHTLLGIWQSSLGCLGGPANSTTCSSRSRSNPENLPDQPRSIHYWSLCVVEQIKVFGGGAVVKRCKWLMVKLFIPSHPLCKCHFQWGEMKETGCAFPRGQEEEEITGFPTALCNGITGSSTINSSYHSSTWHEPKGFLGFSFSPTSWVSS